MLRHTLATLAYRGGKALRNAPEGFGQLSIAEGARTPVEILAHVGDLFDWALSMARDKQAWAPAAGRSWTEECDRFFTTITNFDTYLAENPISQTKAEQLFQGPIADAFTHIGQIALLRRVAGSPAKLGSEPIPPVRRPPLLGEHTDSILRELVGLSDDDIANLRAEGAVA